MTAREIAEAQRQARAWLSDINARRTSVARRLDVDRIAVAASRDEFAAGRAGAPFR